MGVMCIKCIVIRSVESDDLESDSRRSDELDNCRTNEAAIRLGPLRPEQMRESTSGSSSPRSHDRVQSPGSSHRSLITCDKEMGPISVSTLASYSLQIFDP